MAEAKTKRIKLLASVGGNGFAYGIGQVVDAPEAVADDLLKAGHAELAATNAKPAAKAKA